VERGQKRASQVLRRREYDRALAAAKKLEAAIVEMVAAAGRTGGGAESL
jgi:hypothetical protein